MVINTVDERTVLKEVDAAVLPVLLLESCCSSNLMQMCLCCDGKTDFEAASVNLYGLILDASPPSSKT